MANLYVVGGGTTIIDTATDTIIGNPSLGPSVTTARFSLDGKSLTTIPVPTY
jgi:hypothetical protein